MPHAELIDLAEVHTFVRCEDAPVGTLLQIRHRDTGLPVVALRVQMAVANGIANHLLILEGEDAGVLTTRGEINSPGVDVSGTLRIALKNAAPQAFSPHREPPRGAVFQAINEPRDIYMLAAMQAMYVLVCLFDAAKAKIGVAVDQLRLHELSEIGEASVVLIEQPRA